MSNSFQKKIMERVVSFEKKRSWRILFQIFGLIILIFSLAILFFYLVARDIFEQKSFELLTLFGEDFEIIKAYWKDTLSIFWDELPQGKVIVGIIFLIIGFFIILFFWTRIRLIFRRLKSLAKIKF